MEIVQGGQKIGTCFVRLITWSNIDQFSNFVHFQNQEKICNDAVTKDSTTRQVCRYITLWNVSLHDVTVTLDNKWDNKHVYCG